MYIYIYIHIYIYIYIYTCIYRLSAGKTGTWPNGYLVFFSPAVSGPVGSVKFLKVCFPGGVGTH